ncbi:MAG: DUF3422 domain-containing protein [Thiohalocapsa sp.]|uniref:DUF3422 family protein n=1 Tax=Thiohalocapsa sp. TaxID=2497641 RepID=UPI0026009717|nr:DUF3422 domain-containing protein [Thiohalocapsa sp.]MCG6942442.1 DUF3422 domain-containing protein [Thiohalocapsa sp.]
MSLPFPEHPLRYAVAQELHVRTFEPVRAPVAVSHFAYQCGERGTGANVAHLLRLLEHFGVDAPPPAEVGQYFFVDLGDWRLRWERHTEFVTYGFSRALSPERAAAHPFADEPLAGLPPEWLAAMPGQVVAAVQLVLESEQMPERSPADLMTIFAGNPVIGAEVAGGAGLAWSDLRIHDDGFGRMLLRDRGLTDAQAGRLVKRVLDLNTYRAMTLLGLPAARDAAAALSDAERRLADVAARMGRANGGEPGAAVAAPTSERALLRELTDVAAEVESVAARTASRFDATVAYHQVVQQRLQQLRQERIQGLPTFTEFLEVRLAPAVSTCRATARRQESLADRAARMTALLRARVEVRLQEQNRSLLDSMARRAKLQLRLQETVEGLSVVAISYYGVGLVGYLLKGIAAAGVPLDTGVGTAAALPLVLLGVWLGLKRTKERLQRDEER